MQFFCVVEMNLCMYKSIWIPHLAFPLPPSIFLSFDLVLNFHLALVRGP